MSIWGTARGLSARFEVGQGSSDLPAGLEVGQNSQDLPTRFLVRDAASTDLYASFMATRSRDLLGGVDIRRSAALDLLSRTDIRGIGSADLHGTAYVGHSAALYCEFEVGQGATEVLTRVTVQHSGSAELLSKFEAQTTAELLGKAEIRGLSSAELLAWLEVGQGVRDLLARGEVGQGSVDLLGRCDIRQSSSAGLLTKLSIPTSVDLLARFRPAQEVLNLSGRLVVRHPAYPLWLGGKFSVGLTNTYLDMRSSLTVMRSAYPELVSGFVVRRAGIPAELLGGAVIRHGASVGLLSKAGIRHVGAPVELACNFVTQDLGDLAAKLVVVPAIPGYITWYDPASWINVVVGAGRGFVAMPWVEVDADVKVTENSSARLTSAQSGRGYKEIRFGWEGTCAGGLDLRREVPTDDELGLEAVCIIRHRGVEELPGELEVIHRSSEGLPAGFEIQDFKRLFARFYMLFRRGENLRAKFQPGQEILDLPAGFIIRQSGSADLLGRAIIRHVGAPVEILGRGIIKNIGSAELFSKIDWIRLRAAQLLGKFAVGQGRRELFGRFEVGQGSYDLLACAEVGQSSQDLEAKFLIPSLDSKDLSAKFGTGIGTGWLTGWADRGRHWIGGSTYGTVNDYVRRIVVHYGSGTDGGADVYLDGRCRMDFGDIRFTAYDGSTLLDYWLQEKTDSDYAIFWVEVDEIFVSPAETAIYYYYGNDDATTTSSESTVYVINPSFEREISGSDWVLAGSGGYGGELDIWWKKSGLYSYRLRAENSGGVGHGAQITQTVNIPAGHRLVWSGYTRDKYDGGGYNGNDIAKAYAELGGIELWSRQFASGEGQEWNREEDISAQSGEKILKFRIQEVAEAGGWFDGRWFYVDRVFIRKYVDPEPTDGVWDDYQRSEGLYARFEVVP